MKDSGFLQSVRQPFGGAIRQRSATPEMLIVVTPGGSATVRKTCRDS